MSAWTCRRLTARPTQRLFRLVEKREPVCDIDIAVVDSLKVLDPRRPIREADISQHFMLR